LREKLYNRAPVFHAKGHGHPESLMSHQEHSHDAADHRDPDPADSRADAIAAFMAIAIAVTGVLFFISQQ